MTRYVAVICLAVALSACHRGAPQGDSDVVLSVRDRASANMSMAAVGDFVAVVWGASHEDGATDVYIALSRDAGRTFGEPQRVNSEAGARVSGEQPPRVSIVQRSGSDSSVVVMWTAGGVNGTRLVTARSDDGGRSFGRETTAAGADGAGNRGWETIAASRDGRVAAIWLDHRELANPTTGSMPHDAQTHHAHEEATDGAARAQLSKLYFGFVDGSDMARPVTGGVCYCCKTALAAGADGALYAAWRHVYAGNIRDIAFSVSRDNGGSFSSPIRVNEDNWMLDGCPENGRRYR